MSAMGAAKALIGGGLLVGFGVALAGGDPRALYDPAWAAFTSMTGAAGDNVPVVAEDTTQTARAFGEALRNGVAVVADATSPLGQGAAPAAPAAPATPTTLPTPVQP